MNEIKASRDPADAPICPYAELQPNKLGKIIWFSGPPGAGKSTTAQLMGRKKEYIYYEGDCYNGIANPFVDLNVDNPTMAQHEQTPLKVFSLNDIQVGMYYFPIQMLCSSIRDIVNFWNREFQKNALRERLSYEY